MTDIEFKKILKTEIRKASKEVAYNVAILKKSKSSSMVNSKELNIKNYINLHGLERFIAKHKDMSDDEIIEKLRSAKFTFRFLNKYIDTVEEPIKELRRIGAMPSLMIYDKNQINSMNYKI